MPEPCLDPNFPPCLNILLSLSNSLPLQVLQGNILQAFILCVQMIACPPLCSCVLLPGPRVHARHLEPKVPGAAVLALTLGPSAHACPMGLPILPPSTVCPSVVKVKPPTVDPLGLGHSGPRGRGHSGRHLAVGQGGQTLPPFLLHLHVQRD